MNRFSALVSAVLLLLSAAPAARAQIAVQDEAVQERTATPGESYSGVIRIRNTSAEVQEVKVYQTDYLFAADGTSGYPAPGSLPRSNAGWVSVGPSTLTLAPGETAELGYRVSVPASGAAGTYWSMVMAEPVERGSAESSLSDGDRAELGLRTRLRFGVQLATHVAGAGDPQLSFSNPSAAVGAEGGRALDVEVVNTGEVGYRPVLRLELFDAEGSLVGRFESTRGLLYPGTGIRQRFELGDLASGEYRALVVADAGGDDLFGARYRLTL